MIGTFTKKLRAKSNSGRNSFEKYHSIGQNNGGIGGTKEGEAGGYFVANH